MVFLPTANSWDSADKEQAFFWKADLPDAQEDAEEGPLPIVHFSSRFFGEVFLGSLDASSDVLLFKGGLRPFEDEDAAGTDDNFFLFKASTFVE